jgi:hypothetical protein
MVLTLILHLKVEYLLERLLKNGEGAAIADVPNSAVAAEQATIYARDSTLLLEEAASRLVELTETLVPVTQATAKMVLEREKAARDEEAGEGAATKTEEEKAGSINNTSYDPEKIKSSARVVIDQLNVLEEKAEEFAKLQVEFNLGVKLAKLSMQAYLKSVDTASYFKEGVSSPK